MQHEAVACPPHHSPCGTLQLCTMLPSLPRGTTPVHPMPHPEAAPCTTQVQPMDTPRAMPHDHSARPPECPMPHTRAAAPATWPQLAGILHTAETWPFPCNAPWLRATCPGAAMHNTSPHTLCHTLGPLPVPRGVGRASGVGLDPEQ